MKSAAAMICSGDETTAKNKDQPREEAMPSGRSDISCSRCTPMRKQHTVAREHRPGSKRCVKMYCFPCCYGKCLLAAIMPIIHNVLPATRCSSPTNRVGVTLRQRQAHTPINAARNTSPTETSGNRNWHFHRSEGTQHKQTRFHFQYHSKNY